MEDIQIFYDKVKYRVKGWNESKKFFKKIIKKEGKICRGVNFIVSSDEKIRSLNIKYLKHYWYTDVITFNYNEGNILKGEIYISLDTIRRNSINYKVSLKEEIMRVMIHGLLHLCGYEDKEEREKMLMRQKEDEWLAEWIKKDK